MDELKNTDYDINNDLIDGDMDEEDLSVSPVNFNQAVIWGTDWTTETVARQLEKGNIDLNPAFQRRDAWSDKEKSRLIESLILGIPVPPIILAENKLKKNSYIVIDGKQRLLSIRRFYAQIVQNDDNIHSFKPLKLNGLEILKDINGKTYNEINENCSQYTDNIDNQTIRTIVIKNWPSEEFLYTVFLRLNTGSKRLSPQELRQALKPGKFLTYLDEATADSKMIMKMLNNKKPDPRMKDIELALRFYAFKYYIEKYNGSLKDFLDNTCELLNNSWDYEENNIKKLFKELENAIECAYTIFPKSPFSRYDSGACNGKFNRAIFELFSYYFSEPIIRDAILENKESFIKSFIDLNDNEEFKNAVSNTTKESTRIVKRYTLFLEMLMKVVGDRNITFDKFVLDENSNKIIIQRVTT